MIDSFIHDNEDGTTVISLAWPEVPVGFRVNSLKSMHFREHTKRIAYWRDETFVKLGAGAPPLQWARVEVREIVPYPPDHRWFPDVGASFPAVKAGIDGLVEHCGLLPDDKPEHLRSILFAAPEHAEGETWLVITLTGPRS